MTSVQERGGREEGRGGGRRRDERREGGKGRGKERVREERWGEEGRREEGAKEKRRRGEVKRLGAVMTKLTPVVYTPYSLSPIEIHMTHTVH